MAKRLFVGNLPYSVNDQSLSAIFSDIGQVVSATVITDRYSGRSKGFGFVEMEDADAQKAIETKNGMEVEGRKIIVNEARPKEERPRNFDNRRPR